MARSERNQVTQLIYIGGYGRSGSTLLEALLTTSPDVVACGETVNALRRPARETVCSCGRQAAECRIWGPVLAPYDQFQKLSHSRLDQALFRVVSAGSAVMVDSSKTAWGEAISPFRLRRLFGDGFQLVHLVRDPRAVAWSRIRGNAQQAKLHGTVPANVPRVCTVGALGWMSANLACELFSRLYPGQYMRVHYGDLARSPQQTLSRIFEKLLPGQAQNFEEINVSDNRHQLFGNGLRVRPISIAEIREDDEWKERLPPANRRWVEVLSAGLRGRYGYS